MTWLFVKMTDFRLYALYIGAYISQTLVDELVSSVDLVNVVDDASAVCG